MSIQGVTDITSSHTLWLILVLYSSILFMHHPLEYSLVYLPQLSIVVYDVTYVYHTLYIYHSRSMYTLLYMVNPSLFLLWFYSFVSAFGMALPLLSVLTMIYSPSHTLVLYVSFICTSTLIVSDVLPLLTISAWHCSISYLYR